MFLRDDDGVQRPLSQVTDAPLHVLDARGVETGRSFAPHDVTDVQSSVTLGETTFHQHQLVTEMTPLGETDWVVAQCIETQFDTAVKLANPPAWDRERIIMDGEEHPFEPQVSADGTPVWGY